MKKHLLLFFLSTGLLLTSCSEMRFGHLAKVKNTSKKIKETKHVENISVAKIVNNDKTLDSVFFGNNKKEILANESKNSQIHPKKHIFLSKDFGIKNMITQNISKKRNIKFEIFQEEIDPSVENTKKENANAIAGFVFGILALFCLLGLISILTSPNLFAILLALVVLTFGQILFSLMAIIFGGVALRQINNHPEYYTDNSLAITAIIMGIILIAALFLLLK